MTQARVTSIDAVQSFRTAMHEYAHDLRDGLTMLTLEVRRAVEWLDQDRPRYWPEQARRASDELAQAKSELARCQLRIDQSGNPPSCLVEKKAVDQAKRRVSYCEDKVRVVQHWRRMIRHDLDEFEGRITNTQDYLDGEWQRALAAIERILRALDSYVAVSAEAPTSLTVSLPAGGSETSGDTRDPAVPREPGS